MKTLRLEHILFELESWMRTLIFMEKENTKIKIHLAMITKISTGDELLKKIEHLHNSLINNDHLLLIMRNFIKKQIDTLKHNANYYTESIKHRQKFRKGMLLIEKQFNEIKEKLLLLSANLF